jgi:hypothetical protein
MPSDFSAELFLGKKGQLQKASSLQQIQPLNLLLRSTLTRSVFYMRESQSAPRSSLSLTVRKACSTHILMPNLEMKQSATTFQTVEQGDPVNHASSRFCGVADPNQRVSASCCQDILGSWPFRSCAQRPKLALWNQDCGGCDWCLKTGIWLAGHCPPHTCSLNSSQHSDVLLSTLCQGSQGAAIPGSRRSRVGKGRGPKISTDSQSTEIDLVAPL